MDEQEKHVEKQPPETKEKQDIKQQPEKKEKKDIKQQPEKKEKKDKRKSGEPNVIEKLAAFRNEVVGELKKIVWPDRKELQKKTITVIITSLLFALVIFGFDSIYLFILQRSVPLIELLGG